MEKYEIHNENNISISVTNFGLRIMSLKVPNNRGVLVDVVLGFDDLDDYHKKEGQYFGSIIGQYANRIEGGQFSIHKNRYQLEKNEGNNHIHGGSKGYHTVIWKLIEASIGKLKFYHFFEDNTNGYPGNTHVFVTYSITNDDEFIIEYEVTSDKDTIINVTNHSYFNLKGEGNGDVLDHLITIHSDFYLQTNKDLIPEEIKLVENTPLDLRLATRIGNPSAFEHPELKNSKGFDHCYVLKKQHNDELVHAATLEEISGGIIMKVYTTEPGMQFYTGNFLNGSLTGKSGYNYHEYAGVCLETQRYPNSPNRSDFPTSVLKSNTRFTSKTIYQFSTKNN